MATVIIFGIGVLCGACIVIIGIGIMINAQPKRRGQG